jgi:hypothetical protein
MPKDPKKTSALKGLSDAIKKMIGPEQPKPPRNITGARG